VNAPVNKLRALALVYVFLPYRFSYALTISYLLCKRCPQWLKSRRENSVLRKDTALSAMP
jgi:hypothetical protein